MKNPYEHDWLEDEVRVSRTGQWLALGVFLLFLVVPAASLLVPSLRIKKTEVPASSLKERLTAWETATKTLPLLEQWRRKDQARVTGSFGGGNAKVFAGENGWLYYRPDLEAITGKGPEHLEPPSVAREKSAKAWQPPLPVIRDFAAQLAGRNIRLVFVPVPTKPMVCREGLGLEAGASIPPAWNLIGNDLAAAGKVVVMVSSDLPEVLGMADRILVMHDGRISGRIDDASTATQESIMELAVT
jgi:hypothetical protein